MHALPASEGVSERRGRAICAGRRGWPRRHLGLREPTSQWLGTVSRFSKLCLQFPGLCPTKHSIETSHGRHKTGVCSEPGLGPNHSTGQELVRDSWLLCQLFPKQWQSDQRVYWNFSSEHPNLHRPPLQQSWGGPPGVSSPLLRPWDISLLGLLNKHPRWGLKHRSSVSLGSGARSPRSSRAGSF